MPPNIIEAIKHPNLLGTAFPDGLESWANWLTILKAIFGLPMTTDEFPVYQACTGRERPTERPVREFWGIIGRRGGKSFMVSVIAAYLGLFYDYTPYLSPGERGVIQIIASDRQQARVIFRYISGILNSNPVLRQYIKRETSDSIELTTGVDIEVTTCSFRTVRGRTLVAAILDEVAFWRVDGANPAHEILTAIGPGMVSIPTAMRLGIATPYSRAGIDWEILKKNHGKDDPDILVAQAATRIMNPLISEDFVKRELAKDEASAIAEWLAIHRADIESAFSREPLEACVIPDRYELPPISDVRYVGFTDSSGGSRDSFTLAISHKEKNGVRVLDLVREVKPPFSPDQVCEDFAKILKRYGCRSVTGDRYAGEWPRERFREYGINYKVSKKPKSEIYKDFLPLVNSGEVELLDVPRMLNQIIGLERRTARSGRDSIDHGPKGFDDLANAVAGSLVEVAARRKRGGVWGSEYVARRGSSQQHRRPPLALIANPGIVLRAEQMRKRPKRDSYLDALLSGKVRIISRR